MSISSKRTRNVLNVRAVKDARGNLANLKEMIGEKQDVNVAIAKTPGSETKVVDLTDNQRIGISISGAAKAKAAGAAKAKKHRSSKAKAKARVLKRSSTSARNIKRQASISKGNVSALDAAAASGGGSGTVSKATKAPPYKKELIAQQARALADKIMNANREKASQNAAMARARKKPHTIYAGSSLGRRSKRNVTQGRTATRIARQGLSPGISRQALSSAKMRASATGAQNVTVSIQRQISIRKKKRTSSLSPAAISAIGRSKKVRLNYSKKRAIMRRRGPWRVLKPIAPVNLPRGLQAATMLRPIPIVNIFTPPEPAPTPNVPPDVTAESSADEFVYDSPLGLTQVLREASVSTYRPEIIGILDFMPLYTDNGHKNETHDLFDIRYLTRQLKIENVEDALSALKSENVESSYSAIEENYSNELIQVNKFMNVLSSTIEEMELAKISLDIKDNTATLANAAQQLISAEGDNSSANEMDMDLRSIFINRLDFSSVGYDKFANTKVLGQFLEDMYRSISRHSYGLLSENNPARQQDESSVKINYDWLSPAHTFKFRLKNLGDKKFDATDSIDYMTFVSSMPTDAEDALKLMIVSLSRELVISAGIGYLKEKTLGKRFKVATSRSAGLWNSLGDTGRTILSNTRPEGSIADFMIVEDSSGNKILPFETRTFRDKRNKVFYPGSHAFIDVATRGNLDPAKSSKPLDVSAYAAFANEFNKVTSDSAEFLTGLMNLEDAEETLYPVSIYKDVLRDVRTATLGLAKKTNINKRQGVIVSLLKQCVMDRDIRHNMFIYLTELRDVLDSSTRGSKDARQLTPFSRDTPVRKSRRHTRKSSRSTVGTSAPTMSTSISTTLGGRISSLPVVNPNLLVESSKNPLADISKVIADMYAENIEKASYREARQFRKYRVDPEAVYETLLSLSSSSRRSEDIFTKILDLSKTLQASAYNLSRRDNGNENFSKDGNTLWHKLDEDAILMMIFEIYLNVTTRYISSTAINVGGKDYIAFKLDANNSSISAIEEILDISKVKDKMTVDRLRAERTGAQQSHSQASRDTLAQRGELSLTGAVMQNDDEEDSNAVFDNMMSTMDSFNDDISFIKNGLVILEVLGNSVNNAAVRLTDFFNIKDSNSDIKKSLKTLVGNRLGRQILSSLSYSQVRLMRNLSSEIIADPSTDSYISALRTVTENEINAMQIVLKDPYLSGVSAENVRILSVGIPAGMIAALTNPPYILGDRESTESLSEQSVIRVNVYKRDLEFGDLVFKPKSFLFDASLFIMPGAFEEVDKRRETFSTLLESKVKFSQIDTTDVRSSLFGSEILENKIYESVDNRGVGRMLSNHVVDYVLKQYYQLMFGINMFESTFVNDDNLLDLLIDSDGMSALMLSETNEAVAPFITTGDVPLSNLVETITARSTTTISVADADKARSYLVPSINDIITSGEDLQEELESPELTTAQLDEFRMLCSSNIFSSAVMKQRIVAPKIFDRVFMLAVEPDDFDIDIDATISTDSGKSTYNSKLLAEITEQVPNSAGEMVTRLRPRKKSENYSAFNEFFVTISFVTKGSE